MGVLLALLGALGVLIGLVLLVLGAADTYLLQGVVKVTKVQQELGLN